MRIFLLALVSIGGLFSLAGFGFAQSENPNTIGASPCGTEAKPIEVSSPVRLSANNIGAPHYSWVIDNGASFQTSENSIEKNLTVDIHRWAVSAQSGADKFFASGNCVIKVTEIIPPGTIRIQNPLQANNLTDLIDIILNFIFNIALVITPIMVIFAGFTFVTGGGNPAQLEKARNILIWTIVGFAVILISRGIPFVLQDILGIK